MILAAALLLAAAAPDPRAADAVKLFASLCASSRGSRGVAVARLGDGSDMGRRLTEDELRDLHDGRDGGMAWTLQSPSGAELLLDFQGPGRCAVHVEDADAGALRTAFQSAARELAAGFGATLSVPVETDTDAEGNRIRSLGYTYAVAGRLASVTLSASARPIDGRRYLMDFAFLDD